MWNDVFLCDDGPEKLAILLVDTQGLFDSKTPPEVNARIFATTLLLSSVQIFNVKERVREDQLEYLKVGLLEWR